MLAAKAGQSSIEFDRSKPTRPWLSVVIPTHHGEKWLSATLDSLVVQTCSGFECILVDSSATAATLDVAERYRTRLPLRIEHRPDIKDWQGKTNFGAEIAAAAHVCMLHQDDLWDERRGERVQAWLAADPDVAMHLHPCWIVNERANRLGLWRCPLPAVRLLPGDVRLERLLVQNFIAICAPVIRRDLFLAVGGLDRTLWYTADWDLYLKLFREGPIHYHPEALASYRVHADALTIRGSRDAADFEAQLTQVLDRHWLNEPRKGLQRLRSRAEASIAINVALARALHGGKSKLLATAIKVLRLGPLGLAALLRDTRLVERLLPRARLYVRGRLKT